MDNFIIQKTKEEEPVKAFFIALLPDITSCIRSPKTYKDTKHLLEGLIQDYLTGSKKYIIAEERALDVHQETEGYHFHIVANMTSQSYANFVERYIKKMWKLNGSAKGGRAKQYGKVTKINDLDKMKAYTIKDNNFLTNYTENELQEWKKKAFPLKNPLDDMGFIEKVIHYLRVKCGPFYSNAQTAGQILIYYYQNEPKRIPNKNTINRIIVAYHMREGNLDEVYNLLYPVGI